MNEQIPVVIGLLDNDNREVCLAAHQVLESIATARRLLRGMPLGREEERFLPPPEKRPAEEAKLLDDILKALPTLKQNLAKEKHLRVRLAPLYVLETLADDAATVVEDVAKVVKDENGFVRWGAVRVLNNMAPQKAEQAVPALAEALTDNNKTVRLAAAQALRRYGRQAKTAVKPLSQAVEDEVPQVRVAAIKALAAIGPDAHPVAAAVVKALTDSEQKPEVRAAAAHALGQFGSLTADAKVALTKALEDSDAAVRQAASEILLEEKEP